MPRSGRRRSFRCTTRLVTDWRSESRRRPSATSRDFSSRRAPGTGLPLYSARTMDCASRSPSSPPMNSTAYFLRPVSTTRSSPATARSRIVAVTPFSGCPTRSAASIALTPSGGSYCAMIVPRPGWSRHRAMRSTMAASMASTANAAATAPAIAAGDAQNESSRGSKVPGAKPTATVRFSYGPIVNASATTAGGAESVVASDSHGVRGSASSRDSRRWRR